MKKTLTKARRTVRRILWRLARVAGPRARQWAWDDQYARSVWQVDKTGRSTETLRLVAAGCQGGRLLEFGCGEGSLPCSLPLDSFQSYLGIDVSAIAIERARDRTRQAGLRNCTFRVGDMLEWQGDNGLATILMEECLYYLSTSKQEVLLRRCLTSLRPGGIIIVIVHDRARHERTLETCRRVCGVVHEREDGRVFLTLGPKSSS